MSGRLCETNAFQETSQTRPPDTDLPTHRTPPNRFRARLRSLFCPIASLVGHFFSGSRHNMTARGVAVLLLCALAGGCAPTKAPPPAVNLTGFPPAFRDGYAAGCDSAKRGGAPRRDEKRFAQDRQYAAGWRDGFDVCKKKP